MEKVTWDVAPFGNDEQLQDLILCLADSVTAFVETGTYRGDSSVWLTKQCDVPIFTCELVHEYAEIARARLPPCVRLFEMSSERFISLVASQVGDSPLFFLDAHWYAYWPVRDEIEAIGLLYEAAIIVVHDFKVPGRPNFNYDSYDGYDLELDYVRPAFCAMHDYKIFFPIHNARKAGYMIAFQNVGPRCMDPARFAAWGHDSI